MNYSIKTNLCNIMSIDIEIKIREWEKKTRTLTKLFYNPKKKKKKSFE